MLKKINCSPKLHQVISLPTREQVYEICRPLKDKVLGQVISVNTFIDTAGYFIAQHFRVDILHATALEVELSEIDINAYYDQDLDENEKVSIELVLVTNPGDTHIIMNEYSWRLFMHRLADSLAHELIHMRQARARGFIPIDRTDAYPLTDNKELEYLSHPDEIDAYAYNIACELREHSNPIEKLYHLNSITIKDSINLWVYIKLFTDNFNNSVLKKLLKKVYRHLT